MKTTLGILVAITCIVVIGFAGNSFYRQKQADAAAEAARPLEAARSICHQYGRKLVPAMCDLAEGTPRYTPGHSYNR